MPTLPTKNDLGQRPFPNAPITNIQPVSADLNAVQKGQQAIAQGLQNFGEGMLRIKQAQDKSQYLQAKSLFLQKNIQIQNELEQDNDFETYGTRYQEAIDAAKKEIFSEGTIKDGAGKDVKSPNVQGGFFGNQFKDELEQEFNLSQAQAYSHLADVATKKRVDVGRAELDDIITKNNQALFQTSDPTQRAQILRTTQETIDNKVASNIISAEAATKLKQQISENYTIQRISLLSPQEQIAALNPKKGKGGETYFEATKTWSDIIPSDKKIILLERAKAASKQSQEQSITNLRNQEFLREYSAKENSMNIILKGGSIKDIPIEQYARLNEVDRNNLEKIQQIKNGTYQVDPVKGANSYAAYSQMFAENPEQLAKINPIEIQANVAPERVKEVQDWQQKAQQGFSAPADLKTRVNVANNILRTIGVRPFSDNANPFYKRFDEEIDFFKETNKKPPSKKELEDIAHGLIVEQKFKGTLYGSNTKKMYEVPKNEVLKELVVPKSFKENAYTEALKLGRAKPTDEQISEIYLYQSKINQ